MLDNFKDLIEVLLSNKDIFINRRIVAGDMYCPLCGDYRRMDIIPTFMPPKAKEPNRQSYYQLIDLEMIVPSIFTFECVQCETAFTAIIYKGPDGISLAVLPSCRGGLTTPHTPSGVAYYLDQAQKANSVGANSAAIAMFRGALEHLLFEQGYIKGMLGEKIKKLCEDIKKEIAPKWAKELDTDFIKFLKDLGNASIHPNDGDIKKQEVFDNNLIAQVEQVFLLLLFTVYEAPYKKNEILKEFRRKLQIIKK